MPKPKKVQSAESRVQSEEVEPLTCPKCESTDVVELNFNVQFYNGTKIIKTRIRCQDCEQISIIRDDEPVAA